MIKPNLTDVAEVVGISQADIYQRAARGHYPDMDLKERGRKGASTSLTAKEAVTILVQDAMRRLCPTTSKGLVARVRAGSGVAWNVLLRCLSSGERNVGTFCVAVRPDGQEEFFYAENSTALTQLITENYVAGISVMTLPLAPVFEKFTALVAKLNGVDIPTPQPSMPGASAHGPDVDVTDARIARILNVPRGRFGMRVDGSGIAIFAEGLGLLQPMDAERYRKLSQVCSALAEELEAQSEQSAVVVPRGRSVWELAGEVAGSA
jgi:hypothetical protein